MMTQELKAALRKLRAPRLLPEQDEAAARLLSARFLSEVEVLLGARGLTRRALAAQLGTSPSYVTQLYQGDRLLNLTMVAKLERVLGVQFHVKAVAPLPHVIPEAHPVLVRKLPRALSGRQFAHEQFRAGGQLAPPYIIAEAAGAAA